MSDDTTTPDNYAQVIQALKDRRVELNSQRDQLEFQMRFLDGRIEEIDDTIEMLLRPAQPKRGRPKGSTKLPPMQIVGSIAQPVPTNAGHEPSIPAPEGVAQ